MQGRAGGAWRPSLVSGQPAAVEVKPAITNYLLFLLSSSQSLCLELRSDVTPRLVHSGGESEELGTAIHVTYKAKKILIFVLRNSTVEHSWIEPGQ